MPVGRTTQKPACRGANTQRHGPDAALNSSPLTAHGPRPCHAPQPPLTAVLLVLAVTTVVLTIAAENARDAAVGVGAFKLAGQADVDVWEGRQHSQKLARCIAALPGRRSPAAL